MGERRRKTMPNWSKWVLGVLLCLVLGVLVYKNYFQETITVKPTSQQIEKIREDSILTTNTLKSVDSLKNDITGLKEAVSLLGRIIDAYKSDIEALKRRTRENNIRIDSLKVQDLEFEINNLINGWGKGK